jgi:hypothetical protein
MAMKASAATSITAFIPNMAITARAQNAAREPSHQGVSTRFPTSREMKFAMAVAM